MTAREEHLATRRAAGLFDFSFMGLHEIADGAALQAMQSRDLARLAPGRIAYTLLLAPGGRVFDDATVWRHPGGHWWLFTGRRSDRGWIAERAPARDRSGEHAILALQGPRSGRILARLAGEDFVRGLRYFDFAEVALAGVHCVVGRIGYSGELGYEILVPREHEAAARAALMDAGAPDGLRECGFDAADSLRIECGYVIFDREITGAERPAELGLERLVERGREPPPARRLVGLEIDAAPRLARAWLPRAHATSECASPTVGGTLALGFVEASAAAPGTRVALDDGRRARVARLPFYDPMRRRPRIRPL